MKPRSSSASPHGVYLLFAYTHSKLIDDASSVFSSTVLSSPNSSSLIAADTFRPYLERDSSNGDMPNVITAAGTYALWHPDTLGAPSFRASAKGWSAFSSVAGTLFGGWVLNAITTLQSGMPVTITQATNNNAFAGFSLQRPNLVANPKLAPPRPAPRPGVLLAPPPSQADPDLRHRHRQPQPRPRPCLPRPRRSPRQAHPHPRIHRRRVPCRALRPHQHPRLRPAQRQLRRRRLRLHHRHHHRPARPPVRPAPKPLAQWSPLGPKARTHISLGRKPQVLDTPKPEGCKPGS